jgi:CheY-like chemotaxis protein
MTDHPSCQILLVDDEHDLLDLFGMLLNRLPCRILKAAGGQEALNILETETPGVILLDIAMPGITGLDVLRAVRSNPRFEATRIIVLTAVPVMVDQDDARLIDQMLTKPITMHALEKAVRAALGL